MRNATGGGCHVLDWTNPWASASPTTLKFKHLRVSTTVPALGIPVLQVLPFTGIFRPGWVQILGGNSCPSLHPRAWPSSCPERSMTLVSRAHRGGDLQCANDWLPPLPARLTSPARSQPRGQQAILQPTAGLRCPASFLKVNAAHEVLQTHGLRSPNVFFSAWTHAWPLTSLFWGQKTLSTPGWGKDMQGCQAPHWFLFSPSSFFQKELGFEYGSDFSFRLLVVGS